MAYLVYLAGPITGLTYEGATDWREYVRARLPGSIAALSPLRGKEFRTGTIRNAYEGYPLSTAKGITARDRYDATRCDVLLVNVLGADRVSIGTVMEIAWADAARKPIVLVMDEGNPHQHAMIRECAGFVTASLDEAIEIVAAILDPNVATLRAYAQ